MAPLKSRLYNSHQSWIYETLHAVKIGIRVKIEIRRNAYDAQSHGKAFCFDKDALKWNEVASLSGSELKCLGASYAMDQKRIEEEYLDKFKEDTEILLKEVRLLV